MSALEELQNKPRENRTPLEQCIVDAALLEEAERDGEVELMEQAANELRVLSEVIEAARDLASVLHTKHYGEEYSRLRRALSKLDGAK